MTEKEIGCDNCYYSYFDEKAYPCSLCIRGIERTDKWRENRFRATYNKGYKDGLKDGIEQTTKQLVNKMLEELETEAD